MLACKGIGSRQPEQSFPPTITTSLSCHPTLEQAFLHLECPAALAVLHINAGPSAPRLCAPALAAALTEAESSAALAQEQLQRIYSMGHLDLTNADTLLQLLGE